MVGHIGLSAGLQFAALIVLYRLFDLAGDSGDNLDAGGLEDLMGIGTAVAGEDGPDTFFDNGLSGGYTGAASHRIRVIDGLALQSFRVYYQEIKTAAETGVHLGIQVRMMAVTLFSSSAPFGWFVGRPYGLQYAFLRQSLPAVLQERQFFFRCIQRENAFTVAPAGQRPAVVRAGTIQIRHIGPPGQLI
jgi:hypothetical protein